MPKYLAMVAYRCTVGGEPSEDVDLQVQYFDCASPEQVESAVISAPLHRYKNVEGQEVAWPLAAILAIDEFSPTESGREVVGAIISIGKLSARLGTVTPPPNNSLERPQDG